MVRQWVFFRISLNPTKLISLLPQIITSSKLVFSAPRPVSGMVSLVPVEGYTLVCGPLLCLGILPLVSSTFPLRYRTRLICVIIYLFICRWLICKILKDRDCVVSYTIRIHIFANENSQCSSSFLSLKELCTLFFKGTKYFIDCVLFIKIT